MIKTEDSRIDGERIYLRQMREEDAPYVVKWRTDPEIRKWMFNQEELTMESHMNWFRQRSQSNRVDFVICNKITNECIGTLNVINIENQRAEAGKMLGNKEYWGRGYAKEAFRLWLNYGFENLGFKKIYVRTMINNTPNIKLNEKLGFKTSEETVVSYNNRTYDVVVMEINQENLR